MSDDTPEPTPPHDLTDLPLQPTGSGVADMEIERLQAALADPSDVAADTLDAGIADETAAYDRAALLVEDADEVTRTQA